MSLYCFLRLVSSFSLRWFEENSYTFVKYSSLRMNFFHCGLAGKPSGRFIFIRTGLFHLFAYELFSLSLARQAVWTAHFFQKLIRIELFHLFAYELFSPALARQAVWTAHFFQKLIRISQFTRFAYEPATPPRIRLTNKTSAAVNGDRHILSYSQGVPIFRSSSASYFPVSG